MAALWRFTGPGDKQNVLAAPINGVDSAGGHNRFMISERDFRDLDLNLLVVLAALLQERSTKGAAGRLFVGQSTVSMALARLRRQWDDPLFVRSSAGLVPTPRCLTLWEQVEPLLQGVQRARRRTRADFRQLEGVLRIGMPDHYGAHLLPLLMQSLAATAPRLRLVVRSMDTYEAAGLLERDAVDLALAVAAPRPAWVLVRELHTSELACVFDRARLRLPRRLTLEHFLALPHLLVTFNGELSGRVDDALREQGHAARRVIAGGNGFLSVGVALKSLDAIACMPQPVAGLLARHLRLTVCPLPLSVPGFRMTVLRHARRSHDPLLDWVEAEMRRHVVAEPTPAPRAAARGRRAD
jgi:DNA-binding transcriptional LysR family regulator